MKKLCICKMNIQNYNNNWISLYNQNNVVNVNKNIKKFKKNGNKLILLIKI